MSKSLEASRAAETPVVINGHEEPLFVGMQFRFWKPTSFFGHAIAWFSSGEESHVSMVVNGVEFESVIDDGTGHGGVVAHAPEPFKASDGDVIVLKLHVAEADAVFELLQTYAGNRGKPRLKYAKRQLLNFFLPWLNVRDRGVYCSELAYRTCVEMKWMKPVRKKEIDPTDFKIMLSQVKSN